MKDITGIAIIAAVKQRIIEQNTLPFKPKSRRITAMEKSEIKQIREYL